MISRVYLLNKSCPIFSSSTSLRHLPNTQHLPIPQIGSRLRWLCDEVQRGRVSWRTGAVQMRGSPLESEALLDSLRVLEWDKVCDSVAAFAGTSLGKEALLVQLNSLGLCYEDSLALQKETTTVVEMLKYGVGGLDFASLDLAKVKSAIDRASRGFAMSGTEVMALVALLQLADNLQMSLKIILKENIDLSHRFEPLSDMILGMVVNRALVRDAFQVLDEEGCVKDTASSELKRYRNQVRGLEQKLYLLMDSFLKNAADNAFSQAMSNVEGRWCIKISSDQATVPGLLLRGGPGAENFVEPISAVPLNDELEQARNLAVKAELDVLYKLTQKMQAGIEDLYRLLDVIVQMDMITARAKYSLAFGGTCPDLFVLGSECIPSVKDGEIELADSGASVSLASNQGRKWTLNLRKAYHPILLQKYKDNVQKAKDDLKTATAEARRRRLQGGSSVTKGNSNGVVKSLEVQLADLEDAHPAPIDFLVSSNIKAVVITGPNTGGKTISLKTVGLAALMGKLGLYVLASEPAVLPWFGSIFADIGDGQSLVQSLSTFSGHLKQINSILAQSTKDSLVLLDEVGAGTNPIEGAALGMSILERFADQVLLTMATTHHGELKTLKYSNHRFENACVEFDEENLKPTYKILWGVPGRSNAINIAERLGLAPSIIDDARIIYGSASAEINEVIIDLERYKQEFQQHVGEARKNLRLAIELHEMLLEARQKINKHRAIQRFKKMQEIYEVAREARSTLQKKLRDFRASKNEVSKVRTGAFKTEPDESQGGPLPGKPNGSPAKAREFNEGKQDESAAKAKKPNEDSKLMLPGTQNRVPEIGAMVYVLSLARKMKVLKVDASKAEVVVQASNMKLKLRLSDITF
ncbi:uncharacterized protein LOC116262476 isoform X2 [Nymphaea colorata]|uniref:uncharacterized protein LOC116262476 isoform X2 n=1 Tax=Nymphaea colorata TaxID=210225 RepID=UPI00214E7DAA|nr:uncharacterized protein LOC116262476 isoform X2 [Nymphaea colorata]